MRVPPVVTLTQRDTHRLVPSCHSPRGDSVLVRIADDDTHLAAIFELDGATNDRLLSERGSLPSIGPDELVAGVPLASVINAAFCHAHPLGSRFSGPDRGVWYAAFEIETAQAEVVFHKSIELAEIGVSDESVTYDEYLADFAGAFHDLRGASAFRGCLSPTSYVQSQALAATLLVRGALGVVYPSVRLPPGNCLACFRPALVGHVRRGRTLRFSWHGGVGPEIAEEKGARASASRRHRP
ncbi:MAG: RES family NAD+ phosphorylase [Vicinamibacterales bacterium]